MPMKKIRKLSLSPSIFSLENTGAAAAFAPDDISGLQIWLDANDISGDDGDAVGESGVRTWDGKGGETLVMAQGTAAARPLLKKGANGLNGYNVVVFDGTDDRLESGTITSMPNPSTCFIVAKDTGVGGNGILCQLSNGAGDERYIYNTTANTINAFKSPNRSGKNLSVGWAKDDTWRTIVWSHDSAHASHALILDGSNQTLTDGVGTADVTGAFSTLTFQLGGRHDNSSTSSSSVAEALWYDSVLTNAQKNQVGNYLATKYGLTWTDLTEAKQPDAITGLVAWWKADSLSGSDGDPVSSWLDEVASLDMAQGTAAKRPTLQTDTSSQINGYNIVEFDGTDDELTCSSAILADTPTEMTHFIIMEKLEDPGTNQVYTGRKEVTSWKWGFAINGGDDKIVFDESGFGGLATEDTKSAINEVVFFVARSKNSDSPTTTLYKNGSAQSTTSAESIVTATDDWALGNIAGGSVPTNFRLLEYGIYDNKISDADLEQLEVYLAEKAGVTIS